MNDQMNISKYVELFQEKYDNVLNINKRLNISQQEIIEDCDKTNKMFLDITDEYNYHTTELNKIDKQIVESLKILDPLSTNLKNIENDVNNNASEQNRKRSEYRSNVVKINEKIKLLQEQEQTLSETTTGGERYQKYIVVLMTTMINKMINNYNHLKNDNQALKTRINERIYLKNDIINKIKLVRTSLDLAKNKYSYLLGRYKQIDEDIKNYPTDLQKKELERENSKTTLDKKITKYEEKIALLDSQLQLINDKVNSLKKIPIIDLTQLFPLITQPLEFGTPSSGTTLPEILSVTNLTLESPKSPKSPKSPSSNVTGSILKSSLSGTDSTPKSSSSGTDSTPKSSSPSSGTGSTPKSPSSGTGSTPKSPSSGTGSTPKSPKSPSSNVTGSILKSSLSGTDSTPKSSSPSSGTGSTPKSPSSGTGSTPKSPSSGTGSTPKSPSSGTSSTPESPKSPSSGTSSTPKSPSSGTGSTLKSAQPLTSITKSLPKSPSSDKSTTDTISLTPLTKISEWTENFEKIKPENNDQALLLSLIGLSKMASHFDIILSKIPKSPFILPASTSIKSSYNMPSFMMNAKFGRNGNINNFINETNDDIINAISKNSDVTSIINSSNTVFKKVNFLVNDKDVKQYFYDCIFSAFNNLLSLSDHVKENKLDKQKNETFYRQFFKLIYCVNIQTPNYVNEEVPNFETIYIRFKDEMLTSCQTFPAQDIPYILRVYYNVVYMKMIWEQYKRALQEYCDTVIISRILSITFLYYQNVENINKKDQQNIFEHFLTYFVTQSDESLTEITSSLQKMSKEYENNGIATDMIVRLFSIVKDVIKPYKKYESQLNVLFNSMMFSTVHYNDDMYTKYVNLKNVLADTLIYKARSYAVNNKIDAWYWAFLLIKGVRYDIYINGESFDQVMSNKFCKLLYEMTNDTYGINDNDKIIIKNIYEIFLDVKLDTMHPMYKYMNSFFKYMLYKRNKSFDINDYAKKVEQDYMNLKNTIPDEFTKFDSEFKKLEGQGIIKTGGGSKQVIALWNDMSSIINNDDVKAIQATIKKLIVNMNNAPTRTISKISNIDNWMNINDHDVKGYVDLYYFNNPYDKGVLNTFPMNKLITKFKPLSDATNNDKMKTIIDETFADKIAPSKIIKPKYTIDLSKIPLKQPKITSKQPKGISQWINDFKKIQPQGAEQILVLSLIGLSKLTAYFNGLKKSIPESSKLPNISTTKAKLYDVSNFMVELGNIKLSSSSNVDIFGFIEHVNEKIIKASDINAIEKIITKCDKLFRESALGVDKIIFVNENNINNYFIDCVISASNNLITLRTHGDVKEYNGQPIEQFCVAFTKLIYSVTIQLPIHKSKFLDFSDEFTENFKKGVISICDKLDQNFVPYVLRVHYNVMSMIILFERYQKMLYITCYTIIASRIISTIFFYDEEIKISKNQRSDKDYQRTILQASLEYLVTKKDNDLRNTFDKLKDVDVKYGNDAKLMVDSIKKIINMTNTYFGYVNTSNSKFDEEFKSTINNYEDVLKTYVNFKNILSDTMMFKIYVEPNKINSDAWYWEYLLIQSIKNNVFPNAKLSDMITSNDLFKILDPIICDIYKITSEENTIVKQIYDIFSNINDNTVLTMIKYMKSFFNYKLSESGEPFDVDIEVPTDAIEKYEKISNLHGFDVQFNKLIKLRSKKIGGGSSQIIDLWDNVSKIDDMHNSDVITIQDIIKSNMKKLKDSPDSYQYFPKHVQRTIIGKNIAKYSTLQYVNTALVNDELNLENVEKLISYIETFIDIRNKQSMDNYINEVFADEPKMIPISPSSKTLVQPTKSSILPKVQINIFISWVNKFIDVCEIAKKNPKQAYILTLIGLMGLNSYRDIKPILTLSHETKKKFESLLNDANVNTNDYEIVITYVQNNVLKDDSLMSGDCDVINQAMKMLYNKKHHILHSINYLINRVTSILTVVIKIMYDNTKTKDVVVAIINLFDSLMIWMNHIIDRINGKIFPPNYTRDMISLIDNFTQYFCIYYELLNKTDGIILNVFNTYVYILDINNALFNNQSPPIFSLEEKKIIYLIKTYSILLEYYKNYVYLDDKKNVLIVKNKITNELMDDLKNNLVSFINDPVNSYNTISPILDSIVKNHPDVEIIFSRILSNVEGLYHFEKNYVEIKKKFGTYYDKCELKYILKTKPKYNECDELLNNKDMFISSYFNAQFDASNVAYDKNANDHHLWEYRYILMHTIKKYNPQIPPNFVAGTILSSYPYFFDVNNAFKSVYNLSENDVKELTYIDDNALLSDNVYQEIKGYLGRYYNIKFKRTYVPEELGPKIFEGSIKGKSDTDNIKKAYKKIMDAQKNFAEQTMSSKKDVLSTNVSFLWDEIVKLNNLAITSYPESNKLFNYIKNTMTVTLADNGKIKNEISQIKIFDMENIQNDMNNLLISKNYFNSGNFDTRLESDTNLLRNKSQLILQLIKNFFGQQQGGSYNYEHKYKKYKLKYVNQKNNI